jgi:hypothetical protein
LIFIDQYYRYKMDCMFMFIRYIKIIIPFFKYTRVLNVLKREEKWQWRNNKIFCCSHRILEKAQRERCRQEKYIKRKKGGDFTLLFFLCRSFEKIDFLPQPLHWHIHIHLSANVSFSVNIQVMVKVSSLHKVKLPI